MAGFVFFLFRPHLSPLVLIQFGCVRIDCDRAQGTQNQIQKEEEKNVEKTKKNKINLKWKEDEEFKRKLLHLAIGNFLIGVTHTTDKRTSVVCVEGR